MPPAAAAPTSSAPVTVRTLYVWLATYADGSEGVVAADMPLPGGRGFRHMPLMASTADVAIRMRPLAAASLDAARAAGQKVAGVRLEIYHRTDDVVHVATADRRSPYPAGA